MEMLIGCKLPEHLLQELRSLGTEVIYEPDLSEERLQKLIPRVAVLVVCRTRISAETIAAGGALQLIVRSGTDTSNIDIEAASTAGIFVSNCPYKDAIAIAELTLGLLIALDRQILENVEGLRKNHGTEPKSIDALGLSGRCLGMLGYGPVEREIARRALAFDMEVLAWSPSLTPEQLGLERVRACAWPRELARLSDMVSVYAPRQETDEPLVDAEFLQNIRPGAYFVYIGHPGPLDQAALVEIARERNLRVACDISAAKLPASDTGRFKSRLQSIPHVIGTHRLADRTQQAFEATTGEVVRVVREFLINGDVLNCINLTEHNPATWQLVLRMRDTVGVLASIMEALRADDINAEDITSRLFTGAKAAWCIIAVDERPSTEVLSAIRAIDGVLHLEVRALV